MTVRCDSNRGFECGYVLCPNGAGLPPSNLTGDGTRLSNIKILIGLPYGEGGIGTEEFVAEDLCEEDIVGVVFGFEIVATDGAVGASQVAGFPGLGQGQGKRQTYRAVPSNAAVLNGTDP